MKQWKVHIPPLIENLITAQVFHIAEHSMSNALAWEVRLDAAIHALADTPGLGVDEPAARTYDPQVRL